MLFNIFLSSLLALINTATAGDAIYRTRFDGVTWDDNSWTLSTTNLDQGHYQSRISLSNGYFGINSAALGPFMDYDVTEDGDNISGWPLFNRRQSFSSIAGFYDSQPRTNGTNFEWLYQYGGESVISGIPHSAGLLVQVDNHLLNSTTNPIEISNFSTSLDMKQGLMSWEYDWTPPGSTTFHIHYLMIIHKLYINQAAVQLTITSSTDTNATIIDVLDGDCAVRSDFVNKSFDSSLGSIWSSVSPNGLSNITAHVVSTLRGAGTVIQIDQGSFLGTNQSSIAQGINATLGLGKAATFTKYIGVASNDAFPDAENLAKRASARGANTGWDSLLASHSQEWANIFPSESVDSFTDPESGLIPDDEDILDLHINGVTNPFHLLQNTIGENAIIAAENNTLLDIHSISVCGLASDCYAGLVFWDADVWMAPGLVASHPQPAKQIANYRAKLLLQAQENIKTAYQSSQNETGKFSGGAAYPWTSGRFGNCTGTGPCFDYEYHLNGDIGLQLFNYYVATGDTDTFKERYFPIIDAVAYFYSELLTYNASSDKYEVYNATDPDEYANAIDNAGFTSALIQTHLRTANDLRLRLGMPENATWREREAKVNVPIDEKAGIILEYGTMNGSISVKQADVVLIDDFLNYENPYALADLDYYAGKQSSTGPGMTYGVFSVVANEISPSGCSAYTYDLYGSQPYTRAPWYQYSEQLVDDYSTNGGTHPAFPFLTGMGGANRVNVYGYLGLRLNLDSFQISPNLPPQIQYLKYRRIYWQGHPIFAWSNATHTSLSRSGSSLPGANSTFAESPIPITFGFDPESSASIPPNGTTVVQNRLIGYNATVQGNIVQCKPATSDVEIIPGQLAIGAIDGAVSTKWQPAASNITASLIVDVGAEGVGRIITGFELDWAQSPPSSWQVDFSDSNDFASSMKVYNSTTVAISTPYDASRVADITPYTSNTTSVTLEATIPATRYVRLSIQGTQGEFSAMGATVAEFAVIQRGGDRLVPNSVVGSIV